MAYVQYNGQGKVCIGGWNENNSFQIFAILLVVLNSILGYQKENSQLTLTHLQYIYICKHMCADTTK